MTVSHKNRVQMSVSGTPGTGTITLGSAASGYQSFSAAHGANATVDVLITDGTAWEVARACTYTHSGTTLSRGTLEASSTGSAISLTSAAVVSQIPTAQWGNWLESAMAGVLPGGRLTLESGVPVSTTDQTAKTTIYYTPYVHNTIPLWDGARWVPVTFSETSEALGTITSGRPYDVFAFLSSGALDLEILSWTSDTARATAVTLQDGRYCKSGDKTRLLLGTFYTTSTTTTEDSVANRYVSNVYNRMPRHQYACPAYNDNNAATSYSETSATWTPANGGTNAYCRHVLSIPTTLTLSVFCLGDPPASQTLAAALGVDSGSTATLEIVGTSGLRLASSAAGSAAQSVGAHYAVLLLCVTSGTATIYADDARKGGSTDPRLTQVVVGLMT